MILIGSLGIEWVRRGVDGTGATSRGGEKSLAYFDEDCAPEPANQKVKSCKVHAMNAAPGTPHEPSVRVATRRFFRLVFGIFFREIRCEGSVPRTATGGRLFYANHNSGLVDPALILTACDFLIAPLAKSTLWQMPLLRSLLDVAAAVPVHRRQDDPNKPESASGEMFKSVAKRLAEGGNILIFPEGTSHTEPGLLPFRSGAARMLREAQRIADHGPLSCQPVAIEFDNKEAFRSRVLLHFGPVIELNATIDVEALTKRMQHTLDEVLVTAEDGILRKRMLLAAEMFQNQVDYESHEQGELSNDEDTREDLGDYFRAEAVARTLPQGELREQLDQALAAYQAGLFEHKTSDRAVLGLPAPKAALPIVWGPFALLGLAFYWLPYQVPRWLLPSLKPTPDVVATYKLGVALFAFGVWALLGGVAAFWFGGPLFGALALLAMGFCAYAAMLWIDDADQRDRYGNAKVPTDLVEMRARAKRLADEAWNLHIS
jgi:glycerol-3-phosphate O-acyltransferase / dihydroxyacetone phosphate acyltransferase